MAATLDEIKERMSKKATFEIAVTDLQNLLGDKPSVVSQDAVFDLLKRVMVMLRTRFTSPAFWKAGRSLYETAKVPDGLCLKIINPGSMLFIYAPKGSYYQCL